MKEGTSPLLEVKDHHTPGLKASKLWACFHSWVQTKTSQTCPVASGGRVIWQSSKLGEGNFWSSVGVAAAAKSLQSCLTLCDPIDGSPPGSPIPGSLQARTLEWVAISFSSTWKWKVKVKSLSRVRLLATPWTATYQAPPSMGFSRQEYWSGVPLSSPSLHTTKFK